MSRPESSGTPRPGRLQRIAALFGRGAAVTPPERDSWAIGNMAECVTDGPWSDCAGVAFDGMTRGRVAIVVGIHVGRTLRGDTRQFLIFARWPGMMFEARGFRKLIPRADAATAADAAFIRGLKHRRLVGPSLIDRLAARLAQPHPPRDERILR